METEARNEILQSFGEVVSRGWLYSVPVSKKPYSEPVKEEFLLVKDQQHRTQVLRRWRNRIDEPLQYEVFRGWMDIRLTNIILARQEIKKALEKEGFATEEIAEFITLYQASFDINRGIVEEEIKKSSDVEETQHPLIGYLNLKADGRDAVSDSIFYNIQRLFPDQKAKLIRFAEENMDKLMTVKIVRKFKIYRE